MIKSHLAAVSGTGVLSPNLVADSLTDALRPQDGEIRLMVPASAHRLTVGVRTVVEWAWDGDVPVIAIVDGGSSGDLVEEFLADGADEVVKGANINQIIASSLVKARPNACLLVVGNEGSDPETIDLMRRCHDAGVPVLDLALGLLEIEPIDLNEGDLSTFPDTGPADSADTEINQQMEDAELDEPAESPAAETLPEPRRLTVAETVAALRKRAAELARLAQELVADIDGIDSDGALPASSRTARSRGPRTLVSLDKGRTWHPRGRGRIPAGALTRLAD